MPYNSWTPGSLPPFGLRHSFRTARSGQISWTHIFSAQLVNAERMGFTRQKNSIRTPYIGSDILRQVGMQGVSTVGLPTVPEIAISGITTATEVPFLVFPITGYQWTDNLTWTRGEHTPRIGLTVVRDHVANTSGSGTNYGLYNFSGTFTGSPYADFLLGLPQTTSLDTPNPPSHSFGNWWNAYAQDHWKMRPALTLDYGLR
jgi:hypothetical protein